MPNKISYLIVCLLLYDSKRVLSVILMYTDTVYYIKFVIFSYRIFSYRIFKFTLSWQII